MVLFGRSSGWGKGVGHTFRRVLFCSVQANTPTVAGAHLFRMEEPAATGTESIVDRTPLAESRERKFTEFRGRSSSTNDLNCYCPWSYD